MMFLGLLIGISMTSLCMASTQTPTLTSCSSAQQVQLSNVAITDAELGKTMTLNFTLAITSTLNSSPKLKLTVTKNNGQQIACIANVGSCTYKLCGGTTDVEKGLGSLWNNTCPIAPNTYTQSLAAELPEGIGFLLGNGTLTFKIDVQNGGQSVGCQQFKVNVKLN
ncbi:putative immunoglobulin-binding protein [Ixodes scapularis]